MDQSRNLFTQEINGQVKSNLVKIAFEKVDRKYFVPSKFAKFAYSDSAIPLGGNSSISQPSLVAQMIDLLDLTGKEHVLEIGTGSGYSATILSLCCREVDSIEINSKLAKTAENRLKKLGFNNIIVHVGDGSFGLPSKAPFDAIIVTAAVREIPQALIDQLKERGRIVVPVQTGNSDRQELMVGIKEKDKLELRPVTEVRFVPLV